MASNAQPLDVLLSAFDLAGQLGDGANLYAYLAANAINRRAPNGLTSLLDLLGSGTAGVDEAQNPLDRGLSVLSRFEGLAQLMMGRNQELENFTELTAEGSQDLALEVFEMGQRDTPNALEFGYAFGAGSARRRVKSVGKL